MSDVDLQEGLARHRGFAVKAREVLLEPPAPFVVVAETSGNSSDESNSQRSPHRGFTAKAREMLVERQPHNSHHGSKSFREAVRSDFDIHHKQQLNSSYLTLDKSPVQQAAVGYEEKEILIPHSKLSRIKAHKLLGETGKTRSANEIFYDKCMKRVRNPLLRCDLQSTRFFDNFYNEAKEYSIIGIFSSSHGNLTAKCPDSQRSDASETAKMMDCMTFDKIETDIDDK
ncbi:unnamed protein product [Acanthocheilonema viteae]|uniref:Uncharacterized protein n=1 Tax=Acanthocheilonema viteae TaxID=6277 RepID=A0A498SDW6_ACAVI|nr:unnamed protein product [Acanthocheilonema viteae]